MDAATQQQLLEKYRELGSKRAAAKAVGVSWGTASRFFAAMPEPASGQLVISPQRSAIVAASLWDTRQALSSNYDRLNGLIGELEQGLTSPAAMMVYLAALKEAREHIRTSMQVYQLLVDVDEVRKFQAAVLEAIAEVDEDVRERVICKLQEYAAMGLAQRGT